MRPSSISIRIIILAESISSAMHVMSGPLTCAHANCTAAWKGKEGQGRAEAGGCAGLAADGGKCGMIPDFAPIAAAVTCCMLGRRSGSAIVSAEEAEEAEERASLCAKRKEEAHSAWELPNLCRPPPAGAAPCRHMLAAHGT